ncbi:flippase [Candidatus Uhrbacteria bacterium]|nr:flippase [Candidatus Uhrbacteria bacterium]
MTAMASIAKNYAVQFGGRVVGVLLGLVTLALMTRALGDAGYGEFTTATTYLQMVAIVVDAGLTLTFLQLLSQDDVDESRLARAFFGLRLALGVVLLGTAAGLAFLTPYPPAIQWAIAVGSLSYLALSASGMLTGIFQKHLEMKRAVRAEMIGRLCTLALVWYVAAAEFGVVAMMAATTVGNVVQLLATLREARPFVSLLPTVDLSIWRTALRQSWPIGVSIFFNLLYLKSDIIILGFYFPQSEVGIYGAGYRFVDVFTALPVMYMGLVLPQMASAWANKQREIFQTFFQRTFDVFALFVLPLVVGTPFVANALMRLIAGEEFARSGPILSLLMLALIPIFFGALSGHAVVAIHKQRAVIGWYALTAVFALAGYFLLIPRFGLPAAALMTVASELMINLLTTMVVLRTSHTRLSLHFAGVALGASAIMALVLWALPSLSLFPTVFIGTTLYVAAVMALGGVRPAMVRELLFST